MEDSLRDLTVAVGMATTDGPDGDAWLVFLNLPNFQKVFLGFYTVDCLCFGRNRVNIQGVSTCEATTKFVHLFWTNLQFLFLMRTTVMYV